MKRVIITILIFLFGIGCGFGAFFMLKTGGDMKREELKSVQRLEVPKTGTKASKKQKKKEMLKMKNVLIVCAMEKEAKSIANKLSSLAIQFGE